MTGKIKVLLLLLIVLLAGCGSKTDDGLHIENHDWTSTQVIDSAGQPLDLPALTCAAQNGALTITDADGNEQSGTYSLVQRDANGVLYDLSLYGENGTAVVSTTEYTDVSDGKEREYTLILSLPEQTLYFRAGEGREGKRLTCAVDGLRRCPVVFFNVQTVVRFDAAADEQGNEQQRQRNLPFICHVFSLSTS